LHDVEALGEGLHHAVLDAVMDHLDEMAGADRSGMEIALLGTRVELAASFGALDGADAGRQCREDRIEPLHAFGIAADHQAVAALQAPYAAGCPDIEIVDALGLELAGTAHIVFEISVTAVDDDVARPHQLAELSDRFLGDLAGGQHDPDRARAFA